MVNANKRELERVEKGNEELAKLKRNWEIEGAVSGSFEIPENILDLEGVEYLLKLNTFNEVPSVLSHVAPYLVDYSLLAKTKQYSKAKYEEYVEKGTEIIERLLGLYKSMNVDLAKAEEIDLKNNTNLFESSKWYITALASKIGKSEEYKFN